MTIYVIEDLEGNRLRRFLSTSRPSESEPRRVVEEFHVQVVKGNEARLAELIELAGDLASEE